MASTRAAIFLAALICGAVAATGEVQPNGGLSLGFHDNSCPILPYIVKFFVKEAFKKDAGIAPALIRILFHDCFPQGCDGSVLLNGTDSELLLGPNLTLRPAALKLVDDIRAAAHAACGPVVSCTDILALATRDALVEAGGPSYDLPLGRRDALAPAPLNLVITLPAPSLNATALISSFGGRGLSVTDLVALSGAHTFGISHCNSFRDRFTPATDTNPAIDPDFAAKLKAKCDGDVPAGTVNQTLDVRTPNKFDNKYYFDLVAKQGLFKSDQGLIVDSATNRTAIRFSLNQKAFFDQFALSMVKMSQMDVLTGTQGEIRLSCTVPNKPSGIQTVAATDDDDKDEGLAADM
jgi:peroxidase